jgi:glycosyltransferase involved in cell wall biosynthesis
MKYSIILPCKNEEDTVSTVILKARKILPDAEIIVVDNNSTDNSAKLARKIGAKILKEPIPGYGAALLQGFKEAGGEYVIMCDADNTYDLLELPKLLKYVNEKNNYDIIIGNRMNKNMKREAMPFMHKYLGNPFLSSIMRFMFNNNIKDSQSGLRIIKKSSLEKLNLQSSGMEIASEIIIKALKLNMKIKETNITYYPRIGESKLRSFNDGWKHLKMMLLYSPDHLFLIPGITLFVLGFLLITVLLFQKIQFFGITLVTHPAIIGSLMTILGFQIMQLWAYAKTYRVTIFDERDELISKMHKAISLENSMIFGSLLILLGIIIGIIIIATWIQRDLGKIDYFEKSIFALTIIVLGIQTIFSGFMLSILGTKRS